MAVIVAVFGLGVMTGFVFGLIIAELDK